MEPVGAHWIGPVRAGTRPQSLQGVRQNVAQIGKAYRRQARAVWADCAHARFPGGSGMLYRFHPLLN